MTLNTASVIINHSERKRTALSKTPQSALHDWIKGTKKQKKKKKKEETVWYSREKNNMGHRRTEGKDLSENLLKLSLDLPAQFHLLWTKIYLLQ